MEKIVLEVDEGVAKAWREASTDKRRAITNKVNIQLSRDLFEYDKDAFIDHLNQLRNTMAERGLTEDILNDILNQR